MSGPSEAYVTLCQRFARWLTSDRRAEPGDWVVARGALPQAARVVTEPVVVGNAEVVVPRLERLLTDLSRECAAFVLDYSSGEYACVAFDEQGRTLANVVAGDPAAALAQALVFIRAERAAQTTEEKGEKH
ncbi:hypothetical protein OO015_02670 [Thermomicrobium sp. 4228-Ro]|uniref:hypothetical protein n=1 Tax=Thermomicrobium sp. 4228-Ro TaxID=2993937 RepID=UPI00224924A2|nr:hypothetical protein [Thermomicrobium sp. 4228-Ro]MCX2726395.1 hypothetical protein [Thermomicrobium sp. 4228-Ro]